MSPWRALHLVLTLRCGEATRLMSASQERTLTPTERVAVRLHAARCRFCRQFQRQLKTIDAAAHARGEQPVKMPEGMRDRIADALAESDTPADR